MKEFEDFKEFVEVNVTEFLEEKIEKVMEMAHKAEAAVQKAIAQAQGAVDSVAANPMGMARSLGGGGGGGGRPVAEAWLTSSDDDSDEFDERRPLIMRYGPGPVGEGAVGGAAPAAKGARPGTAARRPGTARPGTARPAAAPADTGKKKKGEPPNTYLIFKQYAGEDGTLNYEEFSRMLERFAINMIEDKRRRLYAQYVSSPANLPICICLICR